MDAQSRVSPLGSVTSTTILHGLKDPANRTVWQQYVERYRPLLVRYARRFDASPEEAEDIAQSTLATFSAAYRAGRYERARGRLSSWLFGIARNEVMSWARKRRAGPREQRISAEGDGGPFIADDALEREWEGEWRDTILWECLRVIQNEVQPETMRAFELFALEERPAEKVAAELGTTANAVFGAKRRVLNRLRELMPLVEDAW